MNWKTWVPLALAIVLGLIAMKVARDMMAKNNSGPKAEAGTQVVVLNKNLPPGAQIAAEDLATTKMVGEVSAEAIFTRVDEVQGRVLITGASEGAPVLQTMLAPKGAGSGLQALIPDGMRAITIEINETSGVAGNLTPGSRVDVLTTLNGENGEMITRTAVQNVKVQTLGMRKAPDADQNAGPARSVTLLVTPRQAETIELALASSKTRLILRSSTDNDPADDTGVSIAELRGGTGESRDPFAVQQVEMVKQAAQTTPATPAAPSTQPVAEAPRRSRNERQIKVIRGGVESQTTVQEYAAPVGSKWMTGVDAGELPVNRD